MREFAGTPSLRALARELVGAFEAAQLVLIQFPTGRDYEDWIDAIVAACDNELQLRGEAALQRFNGADDSCSPASLLEELTLNADTTIAEFLGAFGPHPVHFAFPPRSARSDIGSDWSPFLEGIAKNLKALGPGSRSRYVLVTLAQPTPPVGLEEPACKLYQLWNPIPWEELRIVASDLIGPDPSEIGRSWMIATYSGACSSNPRVLRKLCEERPKSLRATIETALTLLPVSACGSHSARNGVVFPGWRPWSVPGAFASDWASGLCIGGTLDRGLIGLPEGLTDADRRASLVRRIWREQAAGLFPMVAELSERSIQILGYWLDESSRQRLATFSGTSVDNTAFLEPSTVLDFLRQEQQLTRMIPRTVLELFHSLRKVRNLIAHLEPVDLRQLADLWDLYHRARALQRRRS